MTREEAIELVKSAFDAWEYNYDTGDDWSREHEARDMAIKALEQETVLDKIRTEMLEEMAEVIQAYADGLNEGIQIIDKYKAESEVGE